MSNYCNGTCPMYDAENGECCATDEPRVSVKPDAECFFDVYDHVIRIVEPTPTNADRIRAMSVDEMAEFLEAETYDSCEHTASWYTDWLQQPAKEEHSETD